MTQDNRDRSKRKRDGELSRPLSLSDSMDGTDNAVRPEPIASYWGGAARHFVESLNIGWQSMAAWLLYRVLALTSADVATALGLKQHAVIQRSILIDEKLRRVNRMD